MIDQITSDYVPSPFIRRVVACIIPPVISPTIASISIIVETWIGSFTNDTVGCKQRILSVPKPARSKVFETCEAGLPAAWRQNRL